MAKTGGFGKFIRQIEGEDDVDIPETKGVRARYDDWVAGLPDRDGTPRRSAQIRSEEVLQWHAQNRAAQQRHLVEARLHRDERLDPERDSEQEPSDQASERQDDIRESLIRAWADAHRYYSYYGRPLSELESVSGNTDGGPTQTSRARPTTLRRAYGLTDR